MVTLHGGPVEFRPVRATPCLFCFGCLLSAGWLHEVTINQPKRHPCVIRRLGFDPTLNSALSGSSRRSQFSDACSPSVESLITRKLRRMGQGKRRSNDKPVCKWIQTALNAAMVQVISELRA